MRTRCVVNKRIVYFTTYTIPNPGRASSHRAPIPSVAVLGTATLLVGERGIVLVACRRAFTASEASFAAGAVLALPVRPTVPVRGGCGPSPSTAAAAAAAALRRRRRRRHGQRWPAPPA